jgi:hypothetical protein
MADGSGQMADAFFMILIRGNTINNDEQET